MQGGGSVAVNDEKMSVGPAYGHKSQMGSWEAMPGFVLLLEVLRKSPGI